MVLFFGFLGIQAIIDDLIEMFGFFLVNLGILFVVLRLFLFLFFVKSKLFKVFWC